MANKLNKPDAVPDVQQSAQLSELLPIERLREQLGVSGPSFAGLCAVNGWKTGRVMTEEEFRNAFKNFADSPMDGRTVK